LEAELAKLFTNSWRYIQFATANQFYMIAEEYGVDFYNVYNAMTHNYPRTKGFPKPGFAAGPCLFKDTMQISAFTNNKFFLGHCAMLINEGLPNFVIQQIKKQHALNEMTAGILGMAFKAESDDRRQSLSYKLKKLLQVEAKEVLCSDVFIHEPGFVSEADLLSRCDIVIIGAPHKRYCNLDYSGVILVDVWNICQQHS
jgi:UDP-N-acetyl-D-mannosaminuronic acid dehydrogenase